VKNRNLLKAVHDGDLKAVRAALSEGADPNAEETYHEDTSDRVSITALELAAKSNRVEIAKVLIEHGAKVDRYPLVAAASQGYLEMVTLLLSKGANVNAFLSQGYTALFGAIQGRHYKVAKVLLEHGANPNAFIEGGVSILFDAASRGDVEAVRLLIAHGADVNVGTVSGDRTPKAIAEEKGYTEIVNLLKQAGAQ
jgi:ankyrin repeat protein